MKPLETVNILMDGPDCWILPWARQLQEKLRQRGFRTRLAVAEHELQPADVCFLLGCTRLLPESLLAMHRHNIVVHESRLPRGRGFAPLSWQVLEGASEIPFSLFEATGEADSGPVYLEDAIRLQGTELMPELRTLQGEMTVSLCLRFMDAGGALEGRPQSGEPSSDLYRPLPWDSGLLGWDCAALHYRIDSGAHPEQTARALAEAMLREQAAGRAPRLCLAKLQAGTCDVQLLAKCLPDFQVKPLGQELTFRHEPKPLAGVQADEVTFILATEGGMDPAPFLPLAGAMRHSRFFLDPEIGEERARRVWEASITEHCQGHAQEVAVACLDHRPAGLVTIHLADAAARLHIVGVLPWAWRRNVGRRLLQAVLRRHGRHRTVTVEAFAANQAAVALYRTSGFTPTAEHTVLHIWKRG